MKSNLGEQFQFFENSYGQWQWRFTSLQGEEYICPHCFATEEECQQNASEYHDSQKAYSL